MSENSTTDADAQSTSGSEPHPLRKVDSADGCGRCLLDIDETHVLAVDDNPKGMHYVPICGDCFDDLAEWYEHPERTLRSGTEHEDNNA